MELRPHNIRVSLSFPPDVDTPQLAAEKEFKPEETRLISEGSGLFTAEQVANDIVSGLEHWRFYVNTGLDGWMLGTLSCSMTPCSSGLQLLGELLLLPVFRLISLFYLWTFNRVCSRTVRKK